MTHDSNQDQAAQDAQWKTLAEHNVQAGDIVWHQDGKKYEIRINRYGKLANWRIGDGGWGVTVDESTQLYRVISRANLTPAPQPDLSNPNKTPWGDMTPAQKGALLLAKHEGAVIECWYKKAGNWTKPILGVGAFPDDIYRVRPAPKRETVTLDGGEAGGWGFYQHKKRAINQDYRITFDTIDGQPDPASIRMEALK